MSIIIPKSNQIRIARIKNGSSLRKFSIETKTHYSTLSNIENEKGNVTPRVAKAICDALNRSFDELFEIKDVKKGA